MTKSPIIRPSSKEKTEKKNFPLHISTRQKKRLTGIWTASGIFVTDIIITGLDHFDDIEALPPSEGPFSEVFTLKVEPKLIQRLDSIAQKINCSRAEIVRKIIDKAIDAWEQEEENLRRVELPFSKVFRRVIR